MPSIGWEDQSHRPWRDPVRDVGKDGTRNLHSWSMGRLAFIAQVPGIFVNFQE